MKIAIIGATGNIGQRILHEALSRDHEVTVISRHPETVEAEGFTVVRGDVLDPAGIARAAAGQDAVVSSVSPPHDHPAFLVEAAHALIEAMQQADGPRLLVVGGAGSLEIEPGKLWLDSPEFPEAWRPGARAHRDGLALLRASDIDWTFFSPANMIVPGERTGKFRLGKDQLITDADGNSVISMEDYAVALLDEIEHPQFIRQRFTVAY